MASYTRVEAVSSCRHMCDDGVGNLYIISDNGTNITVYRYVIATDTLTDISGATFNGHGSGSGFYVPIEWWTYNDTLYCATGIWNPTNEVYVHKWNGGQSWTTVFTETWSGVQTLNALLVGDANRLALRFGSTAHARTYELWATTDGVAWASQAYDGTHSYNLYYDLSQRDELVIRRYKAGPDYRMFAHSAGNAWADISGASIGTIHFLGTEGTYQFFRSTGTALYRSTDWGVTTNAIAGAWAWGEEGPSVYDLTYEEVMLGGNSNDDVSFWNAGTLTFDIDGTPNVGNQLVRRPAHYAGYLYVLVDNDGIYVRDDPIGPVADEDFTVPVNWSPTAMSVSPDDYYVYVGLLDGASNPVLLQLPSDLSADPIKAYDPGAGSAIGVHCADLNEEWVWIAGEFGGPKVRVSIDDGATWTTKDPGTWNGVALPIVLGPDDDNLVLVPTDGDDNLFETEDGGLNWATLNAALPFDVNGMDRLDLNLDEIIMGSDADRGIRYSPNNGVTLHDLSDVAMANVRVSDLIIG